MGDDGVRASAAISFSRNETWEVLFTRYRFASWPPPPEPNGRGESPTDFLDEEGGKQNT